MRRVTLGLTLPLVGRAAQTREAAGVGWLRKQITDENDRHSVICLPSSGLRHPLDLTPPHKGAHKGEGRSGLKASRGSGQRSRMRPARTSINHCEANERIAACPVGVMGGSKTASQFKSAAPQSKDINGRVCRQYPGAAAGRIALLTSPGRVSLPRYGSRVGLRIVLFEACSAFTRVTACTLALSSPYIVTRYPKASATSLPP